MKKVASISFLLLMPIVAFATSGACSGHGGVSCSAGPDSDGSVICNDGWQGSSVSYGSMKMCGGYSVPDPIPETVYTPIPVSVPASLKPIMNIEEEKPIPAPVKKISAPSPKSSNIPIKQNKPVVTVQATSSTIQNKVATSTPPHVKMEMPLQKKQSFWEKFFGAFF